MSGYVIRDGKAVRADSVPAAASRSSTSSSRGLTSNQKMIMGLAAVLIGPSIVMQVYEKATAENVDLSQFNMVTHYDTPAIEMMDDKLRIQFCASWKVNGQFRNVAQELQASFPGLTIEGGPYTPPAKVQYAIRGVRVGQAAVVAFFIFGEQILASLGRPPFEFMAEMPQNIGVHGAVFYLLNCIAQTLKSINAFEVLWNGHVLHSKIATGNLPAPGQVSRALQTAMGKTKKTKLR